jgi:uncharacterized membrane protein YeaQ/YmgE (transglycosylase-associated protein family)
VAGLLKTARPLSVVAISKKETDMNLLWFLIVGLVAGWLAGVLVKGGGFGVVGDIVVGVIGALIGGWLFSTLGASAGGGLVGSIIVATIGAVLLLFVVRMVKRA